MRARMRRKRVGKIKGGGSIDLIIYGGRYEEMFFYCILTFHTHPSDLNM